MIKKVTIGRVKDLADATRYLDQLAQTVNALADENEKLKAQINVLQPTST